MTEKFGFVVPLRNRATAQNWDTTLSLCIETLQSISRQTRAPCDVILVAKEFPDIELPSNVTVIRSDFPDPNLNWRDQHTDKYTKIKMGLVELRKRDCPYYVMKFDADDLVSDSLVPWVLSDNNRRGYLVDNGYRHTGRLYDAVKTDFYKQCGSSVILYTTPDKMPADMSDEREYDLLTLGHNIAESTFIERETPLAKVTFPSVVYRLGHGENITAHFRALEASGEVAANWKWHVGNYLRMIQNVPRSLRKNELEREFKGRSWSR